MQLPATVTLAETAALAATLPAAVAQGSGALHIDASALRVLDSSALALLLHARRLAQAAGRTLVVQGATPKLRQLAQLYGVDELLPLAPASVSGSPRSEGT